ncbi:Acyl dehydratase [Nocardioides sp. YR527]|uniref:MaoC family dehydratase n=1 Tax=Nocardioides sp. YR527 TaxID=1881028 RepID=UPI00088DA70A|nr:MaoC/PaaZ C-terminal domain-containing protein [Nocardioides sp. YR527]SDL02186.1 Acyl dehydratase [Nocardioides sp. YR527]
MRVEERWFEDYVVGESRTTLGRTITEADIVLHAGQTGDFFPHHMDAEWMATQPAGQRIAHGTLILSVAVGMTATDINPRSMSYGYDRIRFIGPVFIGDTITVTAEITETTEHRKKPDELGYVHELVTVTNQRAETVLVLTHLYLVNKRNGHPSAQEDPS